MNAVSALALAVWLVQAHLALLNLPYESTDVDLAYISRKQLETGEPESAERCAREYAERR